MKVHSLIFSAFFLLLPTAKASITFSATFDTSTLSAPEQAAIQLALNVISSSISSPNNITDNLYFSGTNIGLGESNTTIYGVSYDDYYNAFKAVATSPEQLAALASLGAAPTSETSGNPVTGGDMINITSAEGRNLGFSTPGNIVAGSATNYDSMISLNTTITSPPNGLSGNYSLESVAMHEIDESLGIGGTGSDLGEGGSNVGDLDLFRYSAPGVRSYVTTQTTTPLAYFSINSGVTVLSYFNQTSGADYADWLSNPIPAGFVPQVQDAFGEPGTSPTLGVNELAAFTAIGYGVTTPEPATFCLLGASLLALGYARARRGSKQ